jgi:hypothetical protein
MQDLLHGTIDIHEHAIGAGDFTIHKLQQSHFNRERWYRGDKHTDFWNNWGIADFCGILMDFEPGFQGRANDNRAFRHTSLGRGLNIVSYH